MKKLFFVLICTVSFLEGMNLKNNNSSYVEIHELNSRYSVFSLLQNKEMPCHTRSLQFKNVGISITYEQIEEIDDRIHIGSFKDLLAFKKDHKDYRELRDALEGIATQKKINAFNDTYELLYAPHVEKIQKIIDKNK